MVELEKFQGHIVLYCKGHYGPKNGMDVPEFLEGLKRIWAIRCGYAYEHTASDTLSYIADDMWKIISTSMPERLEYITSQMHRQLCGWFLPKGLNAIESIVWYYRGILSDLKVKDINDGKSITLVKLPKPMCRVFNRIVAGNGKYEDYWIIDPKKD